MTAVPTWEQLVVVTRSAAIVGAAELAACRSVLVEP
jgi:hypothetical protein